MVIESRNGSRDLYLAWTEGYCELSNVIQSPVRLDRSDPLGKTIDESKYFRTSDVQFFLERTEGS